jgi:hypothetical protein
MRASRLLRALPAFGAAAIAALLLAPTELRAFTTLGFSLGQGYRDARVFNNFTDVSANDNVASDPSWPGFTGAPLAIWKGCAEWGSELHDLTGDGDPHQPGDVGSGGANFDCSWQGTATGVGGLGDRVHSELAGNNPGVYAFTEGPFGGPWDNGWRIRYYSSWTWSDGPDATLAAGETDLQGIACHEYGHALGLGHSTDSSATMYTFVMANGVSERSIEIDDRNGVQSIYGVLDGAIKPHAASVALAGTTVTVTGWNFAAANNELWFTQYGPAATGTPVKVTGLSSNGTTLTATLPANAGPGDVMVKKGGLTGHKGLSNALAIDPQACAAISTYCTAGLSTNFCTPSMSAVGTPRAGASSGFTLRCNGLEGQRAALLFHGINGRAAVPWGNGGSSYLCMQPPTQRTVSTNSGGTTGMCDGSYSLDWLAWMAANPGALGSPLQAGATFQAQVWYRDPPAVKTTNLSAAIEFSICP